MPPFGVRHCPRVGACIRVRVCARVWGVFLCGVVWVVMAVRRGGRGGARVVVRVVVVSSVGVLGCSVVCCCSLSVLVLSVLVVVLLFGIAVGCSFLS